MTEPPRHPPEGEPGRDSAGDAVPAGAPPEHPGTAGVGETSRPGSDDPPTDAGSPRAADETYDSVPDDEAEADNWPRNPTVMYHFHDKVDAREAVLGIADGLTSRRSTGRVDMAEVNLALRHYLPPEQYQRALATLRDRHVVVLVGADGSGRRAGAYALLREVATAAHLTSLSPAYTLTDLGGYRFRAGRAYLVVDRLGENTVEVVQRYEADKLLHKLRAAGAHLVVTTTVTAARWAGDLVIDWEPPDASVLLDHCLAGSPLPLTDTDLEQVRRLVVERPLPRDVVAVIDRLADGGVEAAIRAHQDLDRRRISEWFDDRPAGRQVVEVITAAYAYGLPQRTFEQAQKRLLALVDAHAPGVREATSFDEVSLPQTRVGWSNEDGLLTTTRDASTGIRRVVFRSPRYRDGVLAEVADRYGYELWEPLEKWLREQAQSMDEQVRAQVSLGIALHARREFEEVAGLLQEWSAGLVTERLTASYVLSWLCLDDTLAPAALSTATSWTVNAGPRRAWTAAVALGGEIGVRYQSEALRWLWHLTTRGERISRPARESIADLFRGGEHDTGGATTVVNFLHRELRRAVAEGGIAHTRAALATVVTVLRADRRDVTQPMAAFLLRERRETASVLGSLWSEALRSASHRDAATEALRRTVCLIGQDRVAEVAVGDLGAAVRASWSVREREILLEQLDWSLRSRASETYESRKLLLVLLDSIGGTGAVT